MQDRKFTKTVLDDGTEVVTLVKEPKNAPKQEQKPDAEKAKAEPATK